MNTKQLDQSFPQHNLINKVIKLRLYPTTELLERFPQLSGNERWVWNHCIVFNTMFHQLYPDAPALTAYDLQSLLKVWKRMHPWLKVNDATGLQKQLHNMEHLLKTCLNISNHCIEIGMHEKLVFHITDHYVVICMALVAK